LKESVEDEVYGYSHRLELVLAGPHGIKRSENICVANKETLLKYHDFLKSKELSLPRQEKLLKALKRLAELLGEKPFESVTREDMERIMGNLKPKLRGSRKSELADSTKRDFQIVTRQFFSWLYRMPKKQYPDVVNWMEPKEPKPTLQVTDLLTREEIDRMKAATPNLRDKALIGCFAEAGPRPGELLKAKIKNVRISDICAEIDVNGKTGVRVVHIINAYSDLVNWLDAHPQRKAKNGEAFLWSDFPDGKPFKYDQARNRFLNIARKAGVNGKRVYLYLLRHGSITENAKQLPDQLLKKRYGWAKGSRAIEFYDHLTSSDLKEALLQQHGLTGEKKKEQPSVILCPRCKAPNPTDSSLCFRCKSALTFEKAIKIEELEQKISRIGDLEKKVSQLEDGLILAKVSTEGMTQEDIQQYLTAYKKFMKRLSEKGWLAEA